MALDVIGAGWGRTGTLSTKIALEQLGFDACYHMIEVFGHPEHIATWRAAARGEPIDWGAALEGYRAAVDWPACEFWRELFDAFPDAKVLLTMRPAEAWYDSFSSTISNVIPSEHPGEDDAISAMMHEVIVQRSFGGHKGDAQELQRLYEEHVAEVVATVESDRLLCWSVSDGWAPLCDFLGVAVPDTPFPRANDREQFFELFQQSES